MPAPRPGRTAALLAPWLALAALLLACTGSRYEPSTTDAATIYMEACQPCHASPSAPGGSLAGKALTPDEVRKRLKSGGRGMPAFPHIRGEGRDNLVAFVVRLSQPSPGS